jgi:hypothetical protein
MSGHARSESPCEVEKTLGRFSRGEDVREGFAKPCRCRPKWVQMANAVMSDNKLRPADTGQQDLPLQCPI